MADRTRILTKNRLSGYRIGILLVAGILLIPDAGQACDPCLPSCGGDSWFSLFGGDVTLCRKCTEVFNLLQSVKALDPSITGRNSPRKEVVEKLQSKFKKALDDVRTEGIKPTEEEIEAALKKALNRRR
jgi:hypothetical protein